MAFSYPPILLTVLWLTGFQIKLQIVLSDSYKTSFCLNSKAWISSTLLTDPLSSLEPSSLAPDTVCSCSPLPCCICCSGGLQNEHCSSHASLCTGLHMITVQLSEHCNHTTIYFAAHPQSTITIPFSVLWMETYEEIHQIVLFVMSFHTAEFAEHLGPLSVR